jgi:predicted HTH domain antitoxin
VAGLSFDSFKALLVQRGIQPRLGPSDEQDARQEIAALDQILPD